MQPKLIITFLVLITLYFINCGSNLKTIHCTDDYPSQKDLHILLHSLGKIINFSFAHCKQITLDLILGLFLVDVNLRFTNHDSMPQSYKIHLKSLLSTIHKTLACYYSNSSMDDNTGKISTLFKSETLWYTRQKSLKLKNNNKRIPVDHELQGFPDWTIYLNTVLDPKLSNPNAEVSDRCLIKLSENAHNPSEVQLPCRLPQVCYDMLVDGSFHGYGLTHRLLLLIAAHFGRGCTVFSAAQDRALRDTFCQTIYIEAHYIAAHDFYLLDLLMEQIALCTLDGHSEFISRPWLLGILQFQTSHGCFNEPASPQYVITNDTSKSSGGFKSRGFRSSNDSPPPLSKEFFNGQCNTHVTSVAAAALAASIRFILENDDILFVRCRT